MSDPNAPVSVSTQASTLVVVIDDGKANAITHTIVDQLGEALDRAHADESIGAVAIIGREGKFCAGFDLSVMQAGARQARDLLRAGAELALRIYEFPKPIVMGCTGHALAMGSILLMASDARIGTVGPFKIGLNEVAIGMPVPRFAVELARDRLSKRHFVPAVLHAQLYDPTGAVAVGFLDRAVDPDAVVAETIAHAEHLGTTLDRKAFALTRSYQRASLAEQLTAGMDEDMKLFNVR